jgi:hypothetical protein
MMIEVSTIHDSKFSNDFCTTALMWPSGEVYLMIFIWIYLLLWA